MAYASILLVILLTCTAVSIEGFNITNILAPYPDFSVFNQWLSLTGVANEVNSQTSVTVLATSNTAFQSYLSGVPNAITTDLHVVADTLRYQILLTYYGIPQLQTIPLDNYTSVTTILQTTGRANGSTGFVNIYHTNGSSPFLVASIVPSSSGNDTILGNVTESPFAYSVFKLSSVLVPPLLVAPAPVLSPASSPASSPAPNLATPPSPPGSLGLHGAKPNYASKASASVPLALMAIFMALIMAAL